MKMCIRDRLCAVFSDDEALGSDQVGGVEIFEDFHAAVMLSLIHI